MGLSPEMGNFNISQYGQSETSTMRVGGSVGFARQKDGTFNMVGDFYHASGKLREYYNRNDKFQQDLNVAYGIEDAKQKLEELGMGFEIEENAEGVIGKDGMIRMVAVSYS
jgi:hypothetical protein